MIIKDIPEYTSLLLSMSLSRSLKYSINRVQNEKKGFASLVSGVIMELSLKMMSLDHFVKRMVFSTTSLHR